MKSAPALKQALIITGLVLALRLPFLHQAIQGDDLYYLYGAEHAQIEPLHPNHAHYVFRGETVDMRGNSHPPLDSWILGGLLAALGDVKEVPFHLAYTVFSWIAAMSMLALALRFSDRPLLATVLFCAAPAFVVNGNSFEADLPFLAFWMAAMALFVYAVDRDSIAALTGSAAAAGLAALAAYQAVFLTPILALYVYQQRKQWWPGYAGALAAPLALGLYQIWERATSGAMPASVLAGYLSSYHFEALKQNARAAVAFAVHVTWMVSPLIVATIVPRGGRKLWIIAAGASVAAGVYDPDPLFWASFGLGVWLLAWCFARGFLGWWVLLFLAPGVLVFFAGSARYLLPIAAPLAILVSNAARRGVLIAGVALQLALSLALATVNYQFWGANRQFAETITNQAAARRVWANADWGLRYYLEAGGALPLARDSAIRAGDMVVTSEMGAAVRANYPLAPFSQIEIRPRILLRLYSLDGRSAYSVATRGLLPFEISNGPIDRVRAEIAIEPELSYLDPKDPRAAPQLLSGISADGWTEQQATVLLKVPPDAARISVSFYVPLDAPARHVALSANGRVLVERDLPKSDAIYNLSAPAPTSASSLAVTITVDKTFPGPGGDARNLGVLVTGIGFQ